MKALIFDGALHLEQIPLPEPAQGEVLVKIRTSAICNTDLEIIRGYMGFNGVPGHEFTGEVVSHGSPLSGRRVVGEINCPCGHCYLCRTLRPTHCSERSVTGILSHQGVFAEYIALPEKNLHAIPDHLPDEHAVFTEPLAAAAEIQEEIHIPPGKKVFIFGAGKLGLLISLYFKCYGADFTVFDIHPGKVAKARDMGLHADLTGSLNNSDKAEICVDCTGSPDGISLAMDHLWPRGTLVLKTTVASPGKIDLNQIVINELKIKGSRCGPFPPAIRLLSDKLINPEPLISGIFAFDNILEAFSVAKEPGTLKIVIRHS
jgi:threonine dehydrogenase-like Zn-dependent dehydrogenase